MAKKMTSLPGFKFVLQQSFVKSNYNLVPAFFGGRLRKLR